MRRLQIGARTFLCIGAYAILPDEIIAVEIGEDGEGCNAYVWQAGQRLKDTPLKIHLTKEEYESIQADWGVPSIA